MPIHISGAGLPTEPAVTANAWLAMSFGCGALAFAFFALTFLLLGRMGTAAEAMVIAALGMAAAAAFTLAIAL